MRKLNIRLGKLSQSIFSNYGYCKCCKTTWNIVIPVNVMYSNTRGCFLLCEKCWDERDTEERIEYYVSNVSGQLVSVEIETLKNNIAMRSEA